MLNLTANKMGPDSYVCSLSRITASSPDPSARMPPEARSKARLLIMQAPSEAREARRAACFILQPSGELVRLGKGRGRQV